MYSILEAENALAMIILFQISVADMQVLHYGLIRIPLPSKKTGMHSFQSFCLSLRVCFMVSMAKRPVASENP
jgi:hypothetical protein